MGVVETAQEAASSVADGVTYAVDQYWNNTVFTNGYYNLSPAGVVVLAVHMIITIAYMLYVWARKTWNRWCVVGLMVCQSGCFVMCELLLGLGSVLLCKSPVRASGASTSKHRKKMSPVAAGMFRLAAARGEIDKLEILQKTRGFNIDADVEGWTALHAAAAMGQPGVCCCCAAVLYTITCCSPVVCICCVVGGNMTL